MISDNLLISVTTIASSGLSAIIRITGSVPEDRTKSRPLLFNFFSAAALATSRKSAIDICPAL